MHNPKALLRPATEADLPQMTAMDQALFGVYGAAEDPAVIRARLTVFPAGCVVLVESAQTELAAPLLGYLTTEKWQTAREPALDEDPYLTHNPAGRILNITTLAVGGAYQNRGLGELLLQQAIDIARREQCTQILLETAYAERFYRRHGFTKVSEREQRGIVLHIMQRLLAPPGSPVTVFMEE